LIYLASRLTSYFRVVEMKQIKAFFLAVTLLFTAYSAQAEIVVVVSAQSTVEHLDKNKIAAIFLGKTDTFPNGIQSVPIEQAEGTKAYEEFHHLVTEKSMSQLNAYWSKMVFSGKGHPSKEVPNGAEVLKLIAANPSMIGYLEKSLVDDKIKVVFAP